MLFDKFPRYDAKTSALPLVAALLVCFVLTGDLVLKKKKNADTS